MKLDMFPYDGIEEYNLHDKIELNGYVYAKSTKDVYGLSQAGLLAHELIDERIKKHGYKRSEVAPRRRTHKWRPICFFLVVDDFGINYVG